MWEEWEEKRSFEVLVVHRDMGRGVVRRDGRMGSAGADKREGRREGEGEMSAMRGDSGPVEEKEWQDWAGP
jgi:hypothetical protein